MVSGRPGRAAVPASGRRRPRRLLRLARRLRIAVEDKRHIKLLLTGFSGLDRFVHIASAIAELRRAKADIMAGREPGLIYAEEDRGLIVFDDGPAYRDPAAAFLSPQTGASILDIVNPPRFPAMDAAGPVPTGPVNTPIAPSIAPTGPSTAPLGPRGTIIAR
jgi:hypothetical protein